MSLLTIIQDVCATVGIQVPTSVIGNTEQDIVQLVQLSLIEGKALADEYDWDALIQEANFTTLAAEVQGEVATIAPGYKKLINETQWNRDIIYPVTGSITPQQYQAYKARGFSSVYSQFRVRGKDFLMYPAPEAGQDIYFEFITKNWISAADNSITRSRWVLDDDYALLDEDIITLGVIWRWLKAKNFDYSEDFRTYEIRKMNAMARDGGKMRKSLASNYDYTSPNLPTLQEASWNL